MPVAVVRAARLTIGVCGGDTEALLSGIVIVSLTALLEHIEDSTRDLPLGPERLRRFIVSQAEYFEQNPPRFRVATARYAEFSDAAARQRIAFLRGRYVKLLRGIIVEGIAAGQFAEIDVLAATRMVLAILYWLGRWFKPGGTLRAADVATKHANIMLHGVLLAGQK